MSGDRERTLALAGDLDALVVRAEQLLERARADAPTLSPALEQMRPQLALQRHLADEARRYAGSPPWAGAGLNDLAAAVRLMRQLLAVWEGAVAARVTLPRRPSAGLPN